MRKPREESSLGIYHVMLRGVNRQNIFEDDEDREFLRQCLYRFQWWEEKVGQQEFNKAENVERHRSFYLYAWCFMSNHIHLIVRCGEETLGQSIHRFSIAYAKYFNERYTRIGHLFNNRFTSEPIEDKEYFITCLQYVHQNPEAAGLIPPNQCEAWPWSSARQLISGEPGIVLSGPIYKMISREELTYLLHTPTKRRCIDLEEPYTDERAWEVLKRLCGAGNTAEFQRLDRHEQKRAIIAARVDGAGVRQLVRLTGLGYGTIVRL